MITQLESRLLMEADAGADDEVSRLRAALATAVSERNEERTRRLEQETAMNDALHEVCSRSSRLQQQMDGQPAVQTTFPDDVGSPQRLFAIASAADPEVDAMCDSSVEQRVTDSHTLFWAAAPTSSSLPDCHAMELEQQSDDTMRSSTWLGAEQLIRQHTAQRFRPTSLHPDGFPHLVRRKRSNDDAEENERMVALANRAAAASSRAEAACDVLQRLLDHTDARQTGEESRPNVVRTGGERGQIWIERCGVRLLAWVDELHSRLASAELRELRAHAEMRAACDEAVAARAADRARAERAEARNRELVGALRLAQRQAVDEVEDAHAPYTWPEDMTPEGEDRLRSAQWEQQRRLHELRSSRLGAQAVQQTRKKLQAQLAMPHLSACAAASSGSSSPTLDGRMVQRRRRI